MKKTGTKMNILVIGSGGREHALVYKLSQSPSVDTIFISPGNGGTETMTAKNGGVTFKTIGELPIKDLIQFAVDNKVDLVVPGPEKPLVEGITDHFKKVGINVFGPSKEASILESSKIFAKDFMFRNNIPTAKSESFDNYKSALDFLETVDCTKIVLKADGLASGKGVLIPTSKEDAINGLKSLMVEKKFGESGNSILIEEFLEGQEISILTISDGYSFYNLPAAQDHKRIGNNDTGLNTGGMGAYAPAPIATPELLKQIDKEVIKPTIDGMRKNEACPFVGVLFTGLIVTTNGPKVLEYNIRFGDPETQAILPLITDDTDFAQVLFAASESRLDSVNINIKDNFFSTSLVLSSKGYPESYENGKIISIDEKNMPDNTYTFYAGAKLNKEKKLETAGGRVLAITACAPTIKESIDLVYESVKNVKFDGAYYRNDIGHKALKFNESLSKKQSSFTYEDAGVSVDSGNQLVENIKKMVKSTKRPGADSDIGGFGGLFDLKEAGFDSNDCQLVAATDGVGTKLLIGQETSIHNAVGIDLVAMNVNDLVVQGAEPLFFLDYFASGSLNISTTSDFVQGVVEGCLQSNCALVGGETSEMPGMYAPNHYDCNGTAVGAVNKKELLPKISEMEEGDILLGLGSNGLHSNGFSLVRKIVSFSGLSYSDKCPWDNINYKTLGEALLVPTRIYVKPLLPLIRKQLLLGLAHITGGGLPENLPRALPKHLQANIDAATWPIPPVFEWFSKTGHVPRDDLWRTFNMGIGMVIIVKKENVSVLKDLLEKSGEKVYQIGILSKRDGDAGCTIINQ